VAGLAPTFGRGAMTNHWVDIKNADVVLVMGGNPAEAHPCGFKWVTEAKAHNKAKLIVVDPRFTRTAAVADVFAQIRPGTDLAFTGGLIGYLLAHDKIQRAYVESYTNASYLVRGDFAFEDGHFSGWNAEKKAYDKSSWAYQLDDKGLVRVDPTLQDPSCVYQLLKRHYARYTPEKVAEVTGVPKEKFLEICEIVASTSAPDRTMTHLYALGWTQHTVGSQNIRSIAMIQLLLGNIGMPGGGVNALRGHANVQGLTDLGSLWHTLPGYLGIPRDDDATLAAYLEKRTPRPLRPGQMNFWQNYPKFFVSLLKAWYGPAATRENEFGYAWLPKADKAYDMMVMADLMAEGKLTGLVCQGHNPIASLPDKRKTTAGLSKLKWLVTIDPLETETAVFWKNEGEFHDVDPARIQTEVFRLPSGCFAEEDGSMTNSGRWLQWHYAGAEPPGEARRDIDIVADLFQRIRSLYEKDGGALPDPIVKLHWPYKKGRAPSPEELAREFNGSALADVLDPKDPTKVLARAGEQLATFAHLRDDGSTAAGCWIYTGAWTEKGNATARRDPSDPTGTGATLGWGFAWPANRRILYNRASADPSGKPWGPKHRYLSWTGKVWGGADVPDYRADAAPEEGLSPFIMNAEGVGRLFALGLMAEGPLPEHYEPMESPLDGNPMHAVRVNPAARVLKGDKETFGTSKEFPYVATTFRLAEHFHYWTKNVPIVASLQPELFVEISEGLAGKKGIQSGDPVVVRSKRGTIKAVAVVTKRIKTLKVAGREVETIGIPIHYGFVSVTKKGHLTNTVTPSVGDANTQTPEYKAFLVDVVKAGPGVA
jgi:formate dehydrogenase major subunit